jgi:hypothetical protein
MSAALLPVTQASASEVAEISTGKWVRITTGAEVAAQGIVMGTQDASGTVVSDDKRTATFEVNGQHVRLAKPRTALQGRVQSLDEKSIVLERQGESPILVPRDAVSSVDVRRRESKKGLGVVIGLVAGGAISYAIASATSGSSCHGDEVYFDSLNCYFNGVAKTGSGILGAVAGAALGLIVAPGAKWDENVPLDHIRVGFGPTPNRGIRLSLLLSF